MSPRTLFISRLLGLYCLLAGFAIVTHKQATVATVMALLHSAPLLLLFGVITLIGGLALILSHNVWSGGPLPVFVTIIGWLAVVKGLLFLLLSPESATAFYLGTLHYEQFFYFYAGFALLCGAYLTYAGFRSTPR